MISPNLNLCKEFSLLGDDIKDNVKNKTFALYLLKLSYRDYRDKLNHHDNVSRKSLLKRYKRRNKYLETN